MSDALIRRLLVVCVMVSLAGNLGAFAIAGWLQIAEVRHPAMTCAVGGK